MTRLDNKNNGTIWCKMKTKKSRKGEEYEALVGTVDTGGGKMITISIYANQEMVEGKDGEMLYPVQVSKWKGDPKRTNRSRGKSW